MTRRLSDSLKRQWRQVAGAVQNAISFSEKAYAASCEYLGGKKWQERADLAEIVTAVEEEAKLVLVDECGLTKVQFRRLIYGARKSCLLGVRFSFASNTSIGDCVKVIASAKKKPGDLQENIKAAYQEVQREKNLRSGESQASKRNLLIRYPEEDQPRVYESYVMGQLRTYFADSRVAKMTKRCTQLAGLQGLVRGYSGFVPKVAYASARMPDDDEPNRRRMAAK